jgi:yecA family protein
LDCEYRADPLLFTGAEGATHIVFERVQFRRQPYLLWLHRDELCGQLQQRSHGRAVIPQPLTDAELDRLDEVLKRFGDKRAMNLEVVDGFFAALICSPDNVPPSEYLPEIWGGDMINEDVFAAQPILRELISLVTRHWNVISHTLRSGDVFTPLLLEDEHGVARGNDWANGFMRGMEMRREDWAPFLGDDEHGGSLVPLFLLWHTSTTLTPRCVPI